MNTTLLSKAHMVACLIVGFGIYTGHTQSVPDTCPIQLHGEVQAKGTTDPLNEPPYSIQIKFSASMLGQTSYGTNARTGTAIMEFNSLPIFLNASYDLVVNAYLPPWNVVFFRDQSIDFTGVPECIDFYLNGKFVPVIRWANRATSRFGSDGPPPRSATFEFRSNDKRLPVVKWAVSDGSGRAASDPVKDGIYQLAADGRSSASPYDFKQPVSEFVFGSDSLGCTLTPQGHLTAGILEGSVVVLARLTNCDSCLETAFTFDIVSCDSSCGCEAPGTGDARNNSVDFRMILGKSRAGGTAGFLRFRAKTPSTTPLLNYLSCDFVRPDLHVVTNLDGTLRQVRMLDGAADVIALSSNHFQVDFYDRTRVSATTSNGLYVLNGPAFQSHSFEAVDNNPEHLRIQDSMSGTVHDYIWETNGWTLVSANGLRRERVENVQQGTLRIESRTVSNASGTPVYAERKTYDIFSGIELIVEEVIGVGAGARTNRYDFGPDRWLRQVIRYDGSWEIFHQDAQGRLKEHFQTFLNSTPSTNAALCRLATYSYSSADVPGSGDVQALSPNIPRRVIYSVLGTEVGREYNVVRSSIELWHFRTSLPGLAWNAVSNEVTKTLFVQDVVHHGFPSRILNPDGTATVTDFDRADLTGYMGADGQSLERKTVKKGELLGDLNTPSIPKGTKTEEYLDAYSRVICKVISDVKSGLILNAETNFYDVRGRLTSTVYLDRTTITNTYDCCGLKSLRDQAGFITIYDHDALRRQVAVTRHGITVSNQLDAVGNTVATFRIGTDGTVMLLSSNLFDTTGENILTQDGSHHETSFTNYTASGGGRVRITTFPNHATRIETSAADGNLLRIEGTKEHGLRYDYGVQNDGTGRTAQFSQERHLDADGSDTSEWVKAFRDALGQEYRKVYPNGAATRSEYNSQGQLVKQMDRDNITSLYRYNTLNQQEVKAEDVNTNGAIDFGGTDLATFTLTDVATNSLLHSVTLRTRNYDYGTNGSGISNLTSTVERSADGLSIQTVEASRTNRSVSFYLGGGLRQLTSIQADGSSNVSVYASERLLSVTRYASNGLRIAATVNEYDAHGRLWKTTDARNGTTTNTYNENDLIASVTTPAPTLNGMPQTTTTFYNEMNQPEAIRQPDNTWMTNTYYLTGELHFSFGARTFPVEYTNDYAGRLQSTTTWQKSATDQGRATTIWHLDELTGFVTNKEYADGKGVGYDLTPGGRPRIRRWARGVQTAYNLNTVGDLEFVDYSDSTPDVKYFRDRRGRIRRVELGVGGAQGVWEYTHDDAGHVLSESCTNLALHYVMQAYHGFDSLGRRTAYTNITLGLVFQFTYDEVSRLKTISSGNVTVIYSYVTNSSPVQSITFQKAGSNRLVTTKQYDLLNRLQSIVNAPSGNAPLTTAYDYNQANQRTNRLDPDGTFWRFGYDAFGEVTNGVQMLDQGTRVPGETFEYLFDEAANRLSTTIGGAPDGSGKRAISYVPNLVSQYSFRTNSSIVDISGQADASAAVTVNNAAVLRQGMRFWEQMPANNDAGPSLLIATNLAVRGTNQAAIIRKILVPPKMEHFDFDDDGNETGDGLWIRTYDAENRLIIVESRPDVPQSERRRIEHVYDYLGRRIFSRVFAVNSNTLTWRLVTERRFWYDGWNMVGKADIAESPDPQTFLWGLDLSGSEQGAGGIGGLLTVFHPKFIAETNKLSDSFVCFDGNGNVTTLINADDGTIQGGFEYGPFGELVAADGEAAERCRVRFSTKWQEPETEDYYFGHRVFSSSTGRWLSRDPIGDFGFLSLQSSFQTGDEQSKMHIQWLRHLSRRKVHEVSHPYQFCWNSPVNTWDYLGLNNSWPYHGRCCNSSGGDEWALVSQGEGSDETSYWKKLSPGECIGSWFSNYDCEGMTCGGGFYVVHGYEPTGECKTPRCDHWPFTDRRWTSNPSEGDPGAESPGKRSPGIDETPEGYKYGPRTR